MSFFKEFKDDLSQAMNELLPEDENEVNDTEEQMVNTLDTDDDSEKLDNEKMMELLDEFTQEDEPSDDATLSEEETTEDDLDTSEDVISEELEEIEEEIEEEVEDKNETEELEEEEGDDMEENIDLELLDALNAEEDDAAEEKEQETTVSKLRATSVVNDDEVTVISKGTTINGSISSDGSLDIMGTITGDIECLGKLSITGKITGNSTAAEVYVNTERLDGSINSEGSVKVGLGTVVVGDIIATSGVIAGAVKGEIDVNGPIVIDSTAIIKGNIKAKSVQINNGAVIEGFCSLSYSEVDVDNIFE
ncbi:polymer-forming cytoskeletal protein [Mobilitalea sibirica]|uniref:Polymer-forming cytoskeletal protein n=1 Tax=Mobilitalea sibirica TaxID=1462919 RepID=A0A8J7L383_9FIRM|nr:polymer-forming cytoskeletal protein [Mobilitalea sibirica]MBH1942023.1 polymer-forming cytoskeletal protein [Mobilitalea sibirica]